MLDKVAKKMKSEEEKQDQEAREMDEKLLPIACKMLSILAKAMSELSLDDYLEMQRNPEKRLAVYQESYEEIMQLLLDEDVTVEQATFTIRGMMNQGLVAPFVDYMIRGIVKVQNKTFAKTLGLDNVEDLSIRQINDILKSEE